jgi:hypothetical protein
MKELIGTLPNESGFKAKHRLHQGWWRTFVLNEPEGKYYSRQQKEWKQVCNRINDGEQSLKNFLSQDIVGEVQRAIRDQRDAGTGIMEAKRLYNNLLSSQPLAFNFFGFFRANPDIALAFLQTLNPEIISVDDMVFEYAPNASEDRSAFDFGFIVRTQTQRGFIGFECKYTDTFSFKSKGSKVNYGDKTDIVEDKNYNRYYELYKANPDRFQNGYFSYVRDNNLNQLFRNELLAVQLLTDFDFVKTGLFCHHEDYNATYAGKEMQRWIGNCEDDFILLTYANYFEIIQKLDLPWEVRQLVMRLWARYCGLSLSENILANKKK